MIELNNKYALDGRDPNSYSGIFWVLGRYDRPWAPERPIFGVDPLHELGEHGPQAAREGLRATLLAGRCRCRCASPGRALSRLRHA